MGSNKSNKPAESKKDSKPKTTRVKCTNCDGSGLDPADRGLHCADCKGSGRVTVKKEK